VSSKPKPAVNWSLRPRSTAGAIGQGALGLSVLAIAGHDLMQANPAWAMGGAVVGVIGTVVTGKNLAPSALAYRIGCWLSGGAWLAWTWVHGVWSVETFASLGIGALAAGVFSPLARRVLPSGHTPSTGQAASGVSGRYAGLAQDWQERIRRASRVRVTITALEEWPNGSGFSALLEQPPGPSTTAQLISSANALAEDARLPNGCGVEFTPGPYRGTLWMHVSTVNRLADVIPHPGIRFGKSVNDVDAIRLGLHRNGDVAAVALRESTMILAGQKRSGKSVTLHNITADAAALDDCVVWHLDLNGGGISRPWLRPWLQGRTARPAIDWAAPCPEEALLMAHAIVAIALDRKSAHAELKAERNTQLLPVSRDIPQILIVMDEGKEVLGTKLTDPVLRLIRAKIEQVVDIGGNEACNVVLSVLRSVSTALSTDILKQCSTRATMRVTDQSELDYLFGYHKGVTPQDAPEQGSGFLQGMHDTNPRPFKAYFALPADIEAAAVQIAERRPDLDPDAVRAAGEAYQTRLERMRYLFATPAQRASMPAPEPVLLPGLDELWYPAGAPAAGDDEDHGQMVRRRRGHLVAVKTGSATAGWASPAEIAARAARAYRPAPPAAPPAAERPPARLRAVQVPMVLGPNVPEPIARALAALDAAGDDRMHSEDLAAALGVTVAELSDMLRRCGVRPLPNPFERNGRKRRGYDRATLIAATHRDHGDVEEPLGMELETTP